MTLIEGSAVEEGGRAVVENGGLDAPLRVEPFLGMSEWSENDLHGLCHAEVSVAASPEATLDPFGDAND